MSYWHSIDDRFVGLDYDGLSFREGPICECGVFIVNCLDRYIHLPCYKGFAEIRFLFKLNKYERLGFIEMESVNGNACWMFAEIGDYLCGWFNGLNDCH